MTAIRAPEGVDASDVVKGLRDRYGITVAPGQGDLKAKIFRLGHIGWFDVFDITTALAAIELDARRARRGRRARRRRDRRARGVRAHRGGVVKVLVRETIAPAGVELLRARFDVDENSESPLEESSATTTRSSSARRRSSPPS